jgi:hypothetical protein
MPRRPHASETPGRFGNHPGSSQGVGSFRNAPHRRFGHQRRKFDHEVDYLLYSPCHRREFAARKFCQLIASVFKKQLARLYEETGLMSYTKIWRCSARDVQLGGFRQGPVQVTEMKQRLIRVISSAAVTWAPVLWRGGTGQAERLHQRDDAWPRPGGSGIPASTELPLFTISGCRGPVLTRDQRNPSLDYVRLSRASQLAGQVQLERISMIMRCGNHPDTDLSRLL